MGNSRVNPSNSTTSSSAKPNTGEGSSSGRRTETIINRMNGKIADNAGSCRPRISGASCNESHTGGTGLKPAPWPPGFARNFLETMMPATKKKTANQPMMTSSSGKKWSCACASPIQHAATNKVNTSAATIATTEALRTAIPKTSKSNNNTNGQRTSEAA